MIKQKALRYKEPFLMVGYFWTKKILSYESVLISLSNEPIEFSTLGELYIDLWMVLGYFSWASLFKDAAASPRLKFIKLILKCCTYFDHSLYIHDFLFSTSKYRYYYLNIHQPRNIYTGIFRDKTMNDNLKCTPNYNLCKLNHW